MKKLFTITPKEYEDWRNKLDLSNSTKNGITSTFNVILKEALRYEYLERSILLKLQKGSVRRLNIPGTYSHLLSSRPSFLLKQRMELRYVRHRNILPSSSTLGENFLYYPQQTKKESVLIRQEILNNLEFRKKYPKVSGNRQEFLLYFL